MSEIRTGPFISQISAPVNHYVWITWDIWWYILNYGKLWQIWRYKQGWSHHLDAREQNSHLQNFNVKTLLGCRESLTVEGYHQLRLAVADTLYQGGNVFHEFYMYTLRLWFFICINISNSCKVHPVINISFFVSSCMPYVLTSHHDWEKVFIIDITLCCKLNSHKVVSNMFPFSLNTALHLY